MAGRCFWETVTRGKTGTENGSSQTKDAGDRAIARNWSKMHRPEMFRVESTSDTRRTTTEWPLKSSSLFFASRSNTAANTVASLSRAFARD